MSSCDGVWASLADKHTMVRDGDDVLEVIPDHCWEQNTHIIHYLYLGVIQNYHHFHERTLREGVKSLNFFKL